MAPVVHKVIEQKELSQNYPPYRHYIKCACGFEARLPTKTAVESQYDAHLAYHSQEPYFSTLKEETEETKEPEEEVKKTDDSTNGSANTSSNGGLRKLGQT